MASKYTYLSPATSKFIADILHECRIIDGVGVLKRQVMWDAYV